MLLRNFTWNDVPAFAALAGMGLGEAEEYLRQPNLNPERDCTLALIDGGAAGYSLVVPELAIGRAVVEGSVTPERRGRGIGTALLARAIGHSKELGAGRVHTACKATEEDASSLFRGAGFQEVQRQWQMRLLPKDRKRSQASHGGLMVRVLAEGEEALLAHLQNEVFAGSFGFAPNTQQEMAYRLRMSGGTPDDVLLLLNEDAPLAYCWTRLRRRGNERVGQIAMIGALPAARGKGAGKAVLRAGLDHLVTRGAEAIELTVYQDNTPAVELYKATGFRQLYAIIWFENRLNLGPVAKGAHA